MSEEKLIADIRERRVRQADIPPDLVTTAIAEALLEFSYGVDFDAFPDGVLTYDMCARIVSKKTWLIKHIPERFRDKNMCKVALAEGDIYAIRFISRDDHELYDICLSAARGSHGGSVLEFVPHELKTRELCETAIKSNGYGLEHVPEEYMSYDLCLTAVRKYGRALEKVPERFRTDEMYNTAVRCYPLAIRWVPQDRITAEMCEYAIYEGCEISNIPNDLLTQDMCYAAAQCRNYDNLKYIPEKFRDARVYRLSLVSTNTRSNQNIPDHSMSMDMARWIYHRAGQLRGMLTVDYILHHPWQISDDFRWKVFYPFMDSVLLTKQDRKTIRKELEYILDKTAKGGKYHAEIAKICSESFDYAHLVHWLAM